MGRHGTDRGYMALTGNADRFKARSSHEGDERAQTSTGE
jgi:hypothetical protein